MTNAGNTKTEEQPHEYTTQEIGEMLFAMQLRQGKYEKKMMTHHYDHEDFTYKQAIINRNLDETLAKLSAKLDSQNT